MEKSEFYYVFINANCLAELALRLYDEGIDQFSYDVGSTPASADDIEGAVGAGFEGLDMDVLDGMAFFGDDSEPDIGGLPASSESALSTNEDVEVEEFDIDRYMERAYSYEEQLRDRVNQSYAKIDLDRLEALVSELDTAFRPITARQSGQDMQKWVELYKSEHAGVTEIVVAIRQLDNQP